MRGDMAQACSILVAARQALRAGISLVYDPQLYVNSTSFRFRERKWFGRTKTYSVGSVSEWFERCRTQGLVDLQYLTSTKSDNRDSLAFANTSPNFLACFFRHGRVRLWGSVWLSDSQSDGWDVVYEESHVPEIFKRKLQWENNAERFREALIRIEAFSRQIGCGEFAEIFHRAQSVLDGEVTVTSEPALPLPEHNRRMFEAAGVADLFGGMGSWNDSPAGIADKLGQREQYEQVSNELLQQLRCAVLYAVNEW